MPTTLTNRTETKLNLSQTTNQKRNAVADQTSKKPRRATYRDGNVGALEVVFVFRESYGSGLSYSLQKKAKTILRSSANETLFADIQINKNSNNANEAYS